MAKEENVHSGHRERMTEKLLQSSTSLCDHELLEILLYSFLPRIDTNAIAHNLLTTFGNLETLFLATAEEIMSVKGIGKTTASKILLIGRLIDKINHNKNALPKKPFRSLIDFKDDIISNFVGLTKERFVIYLLNVNYIPITKLIFDGENVANVSLKTEDILHAFAIHKPKYVILSHNHPSGLISPSAEDDLTTAKFYMLCSLHGITLLDHVIVARKETYSYFSHDKLEEYRNKYRLEALMKKSEE